MLGIKYSYVKYHYNHIKNQGNFCECESHSVMSDSLRPHRLYGPWNSPGQNTGVGGLSLLQGNLPNPGIEPRSSTLRADSLPAEPQVKPKNTGVVAYPFSRGSSLPTQELNWGLLHCRQILYQLSYWIPIICQVLWSLRAIKWGKMRS